VSEGGLRVIIGASSQEYPGWLRTQQAELDLTRRADWEARFRPASIDRLLLEHVWEHLTWAEAAIAASICFEYLAPGGFLRCAVPDGFFPNPAYQRLVQVGGPGPADHPAASHKVVYDYRTLPLIFTADGFDVRLLEWWDEAGVFHTEPWDEREGFVYRSARFDHRNADGRLGFTSLIVDARKPRDAQGAG
jgi:predicted SAM-dependent methyltransferase